jgi:hypothetical protein
VAYWVEVRDGHPGAYALFRRHYSAEKNKHPKIRLMIGPGEKMVLFGADGRAVFGWRLCKYQQNGQEGVCCSLFRNEGAELSSTLILEAMGLAWQRWPGARLYTYVDVKAVRSKNPGCCFKKAGWRPAGWTKKRRLLILAYEPVGAGNELNNGN